MSDISDDYFKEFRVIVLPHTFEALTSMAPEFNVTCGIHPVFKGPRLYKEVGTDDISGKWLQLYEKGEEWAAKEGLSESYGYLVMMLNVNDDENFKGALALQRHTVVELVDALQSYLKDFPE